MFDNQYASIQPNKQILGFNITSAQKMNLNETKSSPKYFDTPDMLMNKTVKNTSKRNCVKIIPSIIGLKSKEGKVLLNSNTTSFQFGDNIDLQSIKTIRAILYSNYKFLFKMNKQMGNYTMYRMNTDNELIKKTVILELQHVLVYASLTEFYQYDSIIPIYSEDRFVCNLYIKNRNNLEEFLKVLSLSFEIIIFSELFDLITYSICNYIEKIFSIKFNFIFGSSFTAFNSGQKSIKNIDFLLGNRRRKNITIIDHSFINQCFNIDQTVIISKFYGLKEEENILKQLLDGLLKWLNYDLSVKDSFSIERKTFSS